MKKILCLAALVVIATACGSKVEQSQLKRNAVPMDPGTKVQRFKDGQKIGYLLVSNGKGYELVCDDTLKRRTLIEATGFPYAAIEDESPLSIDSRPYGDLKVSEQPKISCDPIDKTLYRIDLDGTTKYFFSDKTKAKTRLYMIGCQALIPAMGFEISAAKVLDADLIDNQGIFSVEDADDVSCLTGIAPAAKLTWTSGETKTVQLKPDQDLGVTIFSAIKPDQKSAKVEVEEKGKEGTCDWVNVIPAGDLIILSGRAPKNFYNQVCKVTVVAEARNFLRDQKVFTIAANDVVPNLTTACPPKTSVLAAKDFPACSATVDLGIIKFEEADCSNVFAFDSIKGKLSLLKEPLAGQTCKALLNGDLNGKLSAPVVIEVSRICQDGYVAGSDGTCQRRSCGNGHVFEDLWTEDFGNGKKQFLCKLDGTSEDRGLVSCNAGYGLRNNICIASCAAGFLNGDVVKENASNGYWTKTCRAPQTDQFLTCNTNYLNRSNVCQATCDGLHIGGEPWTERQGNGTLNKSCDGFTIKSSLSCDANYLNVSGSCTRTCDGIHTAGQTWGENISNGAVTKTCLAAGTITTSAPSCSSGYHVEGASCVANPPPVHNPNCGITPNGGTTIEHDCVRNRDVIKTYQCNDGSLKLISSRTTSDLCE